MPSKSRKKKFIRWVLSITIAVVVVAAAWMGYRFLAYARAKSTHYAEFGISIPNEYTIHGIDVSKYQNIIAWEEVKEMQVGRIKLGFAFIKATEGLGNTDPQFKRNWRKSRSNDIIRGAYHFFHRNKGRKNAGRTFYR